MRRIYSDSLKETEKKIETAAKMTDKFPEFVDDSMRKSYRKATALYESAKRQRDEAVRKVDRCILMLTAGSGAGK